MPGPPDEVSYDLEEAIRLLVALEQARDALTGTDYWSPIAGVEHRSLCLSVSWGWKKEGSMDEPLLLTLSDAARRLEVRLDELARAVVHRQIAFKLIDGIPHVPLEALEGYQRAS